jgi:NAD dependent epimerase/dehydratase family enzyme
LSKPAVLHIPEIILKTLLKEMADELFLNSVRVEPKLLIKNGFEFERPKLKEALISVLK